MFVIRRNLFLNGKELSGICWASTVRSKFSSISSLLNCDKFPEVSEYLWVYSINMFYFINKSIINFCSTFSEGVQFLSATFVLLSAPTTAIFPVNKTYASE